MVVYDLTVDQASLGALSPRELSEMCIVCSERILTHFKDVLLHFHPAEQVQIISFNNGLRQYLGRINGNPAQGELVPKVIVKRIKLYFSNGRHHDDHFIMRLDLESLVNVGPSALIKLMETIYKNTFRRLSMAEQSPHKLVILNNCKARYKSIIRQLNHLSVQVRRPNAYFINQQTIISRIEIRLEVNYGLS